MELTPDLLLEAKFAPARRGYDMAEVDDFLERCAEGLDVLLARLKAEFERAEQAESLVIDLRRDLQSSDATVVAAPAPAAEPMAETTAETTAAPVSEPVVEAQSVAAPAQETPTPEAPSVDEPMRILIHAERTAEAAIADARAEAERIRTEAEAIASTQRNEAEALLTTAKAEAEVEARRAGEEARRAMQTEVTTLRRDRDALSEDIRSLRRWLDDQRGRMRTTARELQRLVEDPSALRELPVPDLAASTDTDGVTDHSSGAAAAVGANVDSAAGAGAVPDPDHAPARVGVDQISDIVDTDDSVDLDIDLSADAGEPTQAVPVTRRIWPYDEDADDSDTTPGSLR